MAMLKFFSMTIVFLVVHTCVLALYKSIHLYESHGLEKIFNKFSWNCVGILFWLTFFQGFLGWIINLKNYEENNLLNSFMVLILSRCESLWHWRQRNDPWNFLQVCREPQHCFCCQSFWIKDNLAGFNLVAKCCYCLELSQCLVNIVFCEIYRISFQILDINLQMMIFKSGVHIKFWSSKEVTHNHNPKLYRIRS